MRTLGLLLAMVFAAGSLSPATAAAQAPTCEFRLGFKALRDLIPQTVGECVSNEEYNLENGDSLQTTTKGLMAWRKADNWTAFTDGTTTWINGPVGLQSRPNTERFSWEAATPATSSAPTASAPPPAPAPPPAAPPPPPVAAAPPPPPERPLDQLVLIRSEAGPGAKSPQSSNGNEAKASWYQVIYKRDSTDHKLGPLYMVNRVYRAKDAATAQEVFREQANAGMPEAKQQNYAVNSMGSQPMSVSLGEEANALGACVERECTNRAEVPTRHYRIVFRMGNLVETLYTYGPDTGNNFNVAFGYAKELEKRINTPPEGPPQEIFSSKQAAEIGLRVTDAGKEAEEVFSRSGSDDRGSWYEARFERGQQALQQNLGPNHLYNKVWVAPSAAVARAIYEENTVFDLPEATEKRGPTFSESKTKPFGNESYAVGACNDDCGGAGTDRLHERLVYRWGNVVVVLYIWGRDDASNPTVISTFAEVIAGRLP